MRWATNGTARYFLEVLESVAALLAVSAVVICTPGQDTALTIRNTLGGGRRSGVATAGGVAIGQGIWTIAASLGVVALLSASEPAFRVLKLAGAMYLVYLGAQSLYAAVRRHGHDYKVQREAAIAPSRALRQGVISNLGNPKMAVFFASLLPQFAPGGAASFAGLLAFGLLFCAMTLGWLALYAFVVARVRPFMAGAARRALAAFTGVVLVVLAWIHRFGCPRSVRLGRQDALGALSAGWLPVFHAPSAKRTDWVEACLPFRAGLKPGGKRPGAIRRTYRPRETVDPGLGVRSFSER